MYREASGRAEAVVSGGGVTPGDRLFLEVESGEPVHVYVLNEDDKGNRYVLFPLAGLDSSNPLAAGVRHRLPGRRSGVPQAWEVSSAGGREAFLVVAARTALPDLERELGSFEAADPARRPEHGEPVAGEAVLRGIGGLAASSACPDRRSPVSRPSGGPSGGAAAGRRECLGAAARALEPGRVMTDRTPARGRDRRLPGLACLLSLLVATAMPGEAPGPACQLLGGDCALIHTALADNRLADGATLAERALAAAETSSADPLAAAQAIDVLVSVRCPLGRGREPQTVELAERAVAIRTREQGESHPDLIESLHNLAQVLRQTGEFRRAWKLTEQALGIAEARFGSDHAVTVHCLNELSAVQTAAGDAASGMVSAQRALGLAERIRPEDRLLVAESLNVFATARFQRGDAAGSVALFRRALDLREAALDPDHPLVARAAENLGIALRATGAREEAEELLQRAVRTFGRVAPNHPDTLSCLNSLALIARSRGDYVEARRLWERALEVGERAFGEEHPTVAGVLNNLATLRKLMGDYPAAQALLERSLAIRERVRGPDHPEVAQALINLAHVQMMTRQYAQARASAERAVAIREKAFGPNTAQVGLSLATLGEVLGQAGDLDGARVAYERAVSSLDQPGGAGGQDLATALVGLAAMRHHDGELEKAAGLYERALKLEEQNLDPTHPAVGEVLVRLGLLAAQRGDFETAMRMALRAEKNARDHLRLTCRYLSEREGVAYAVTRAKGLDLALSLIAARPEASDVAQVFTALVRSRTLVLDEAIARNQRLNHPVDPALARLHGDVTAAANELVTQLVRGPGKEGPTPVQEQPGCGPRAGGAGRARGGRAHRRGDAGRRGGHLDPGPGCPAGLERAGGVRALQAGARDRSRRQRGRVVVPRIRAVDRQRGPGCGAPRPGGRDRGLGEGVGSPGGPRVLPRGPSGGRGGGIVPDCRPEGAAGDLGPRCHENRAGRDGVRGAGGRAPPGALRRPASRGRRLPDRVAAGHPPAHGGEGPPVLPREQERAGTICWPWAEPHSIAAPPTDGQAPSPRCRCAR